MLANGIIFSLLIALSVLFQNVYDEQSLCTFNISV